MSWNPSQKAVFAPPVQRQIDYVPSPGYPRPAKGVGLPGASFVLGIVGVPLLSLWVIPSIATLLFPIVPAVLAVVLGAVGLGRIKGRRGAWAGRAAAIVGIVLGSLDLFVLAGFWLIAAALWAVHISG